MWEKGGKGVEGWGLLMMVRVGFLGEIYSSFGGGGGDDDGVFYGVVFFEGFDELGDGGVFLVDGDVDVVKFFGFVVVVVLLFLVEYGIESDGSFVGLMIIND